VADFQAALMINHNVSASGSVKIQASASTFTGVGFAASPTVNQAMTVSSTLGYYYFGASQSYRYLRFLFNDVTNTDAYNEVGVLFCGPIITPRAFHYEAKDGVEPLDEIASAINGAHYKITRQNRDHWFLSWRLMPDADKVIMKAFMQRVGVGGNFFFAFDSSGAPTNIRYVFFPEPPPNFESVGNGTIWNLSDVHLAEALG
jgi:hypothetical protein